MNPFSITIENMRELSSNGKIQYDYINNVFIYDFQGPLHREFSLDFDYKCGDEGHVYFDCNDTYFVINVSSSLYNTPKDYGCPFIIYKMEDILNNNIKTFVECNKKNIWRYRSVLYTSITK